MKGRERERPRGGGGGERGRGLLGGGWRGGGGCWEGVGEKE